MQDFLRRRFSEAANKDTFLQKNAELLDRFPALKQEMTEAVGAGAAAGRVAGTAKTRQGVLTGSPGAAFATAPKHREFAAIISRSTTALRLPSSWSAKIAPALCFSQIAKKGSGPCCRNGPKGASHKWDLTPFSITSRRLPLSSM